ncbi:MAG: UDP-N-acetylglucosamine diphosphorylase/glucosamine-1-phosphate N-acetyltransferase [Legionellales bacterium]|nr:UDP-N-acetylglucosamine diphosphorylase/glucosamine-1-phosphate N-acetyltransferase [Legionellales bacterium]
MNSSKPKVLNLLAGKPLLQHVYETASKIEHRAIYVVYGCGGEEVRATFKDESKITWIKQDEQLGTGHAVKQALPKLSKTDDILVLYGDVPLINQTSLMKLITAAAKSRFSLLTAYFDEPYGYGRIIRDNNNNIISIIEEKDATDIQKEITEVNAGFMVIKADLLNEWVNSLENKNKQTEYYLTDIVGIAVKNNVKVSSVLAESTIEVQGINTRAQLSEAERYYQVVQAYELMDKGVGISDPSRFDLRGELQVGRDIEIDVNVVMEGKIRLGNNVSVAPNCVIKNSQIGNNVKIFANSVVENSIIGNDCHIGPFARIRPDSILDDHVHIGNFVEVKKSSLGKRTKANHLSYIGDSEVGSGTNIGAGVITCNYDGANKHKTIIGDNVFVGSDSQLIAPIKIHDGSTIAAGATITKDVDSDSLAISRVDQKSIPSWNRPKKK